jgi:uncharacterized protein
MDTMTTDQRTKRRGRIASSPLVWAPAAIAGVGVVAGLTANGPGPVPAVGAAAAVAVYWAVMRFVARRATPEIARARAGREAALGGAIGLAFIVVSALLIAGLGGYSFSWSRDGVVSAVASAVVTAVGAAVTEELMFRGAALQGLEQRWGSGIALVVTALFFGAAHLTVAGADAWSGVAIALEAGFLLGAAFLWRRNMWFVVGLHGAWNAAEQLLGVPVSGHDGGKSVLVAKVSGAEWLTGGAFGLEASVVPVVISVLISVPMLVAARRRGGPRPGRRAERAA